MRVLLGVVLRVVSELFGRATGGSTCSGPGVQTGVAIGFRSACARAGWSPIYIRRLDELASKCWLASRYSSVSLRRKLASLVPDLEGSEVLDSRISFDVKGSA